MKKILLLFVTSLLFFSCKNTGHDSSNMLLNLNQWTLKDNARITDSVLLLPSKGATATTVEKYKNFELNFECKTSDGAIAGLWFHVQNLKGNTPENGYEVLINNNIDRKDWRKTGSLSAIRNFGKRVADNGTWFPIKVLVQGKQIKVFVNNVWIVDYIEPEKPYRATEYTNRLLIEGMFALINNGEGEIHFRNMSIKTLPNKVLADHATDINEQTDDIIRLQQANFPLIDAHIHLKGDFTQDVALSLSRQWGITYGVAPNCGLHFPIESDSSIYVFLDTMKHKPFLLPMQAEGREWLKLFSKDAIEKFDYRFTDALTWTDDKGRRQRIWIPEETFIDDKQKFMDMLVDRACTIISNEPVEIFVNPTFLPDKLMPEYEQLWTSERVQRIVDACVKHNVAIEINNRYKIPSARIIKQAKAAGAKFSFGTNNMDAKVGHMEYAIQMVKECNLKASDLFIPESKNF